MEFNPNNRIVQLCIQGMQMEEIGKLEETGKIFLQAWKEATNDFEKFLAAWYVARRQPILAEQLRWYQTALQLALSINDEAIKSALPALYTNIAKCCAQLGNADDAKRYNHLAVESISVPTDKGPFYHGTRADLKVGELLTARRLSNYRSEVLMNHIYFTALVNGAGLAAALAKGEGPERVYIVEPPGSFEDDPNVTNKKFPGNPTRSYRTKEPVKIIGEVMEWQKQTPEQIRQWREKLNTNKGEIIN